MRSGKIGRRVGFVSFALFLSLAGGMAAFVSFGPTSSVLAQQGQSWWQWPWGSSDPDPKASPKMEAVLPARREDACLTRDLREKCPQMCRRLCSRNSEYFIKNTEACNEVVTHDPAHKDAAICATIGGASNKLEACLTRADALPGFDVTIKRIGEDPEMQDELKKMLGEFPSCVRSVRALTATFNCLKGEGDDLKASFKLLSDKGYGGADLERICKLSPGDVAKDRREAIGLGARAEHLVVEFNQVAGCRLKVDRWLQKAASGERTIQLIAALKKQLEPATDTERTVRDLARQLPSELKHMKEVIVVALIAPCDNAAK